MTAADPTAAAGKVVNLRVRAMHARWAAGALFIYAGLQLCAAAFNDAVKGYRVAARVANDYGAELQARDRDVCPPDPDPVTPTADCSAGSVDLSGPDPAV